MLQLLKLQVDGMDCKICVRNIEGALTTREGEKPKVFLREKLVEVMIKNGNVEVEQIVNKVHRMGYGISGYLIKELN